MAQKLLKFALDGNVPDAVALTAIRDALDRAGLSVKSEVTVGVSVKPFEAILESMDSGPRSEFRRSMGIEVTEDQPQIAPVDALRADDDDDLIVEGEVLDIELDIEVDQNQDDDDGQPITLGDYERGSAFDSERATSVFGPSGPPPNAGMMPLSDAVSQAAEQRRNAILRPIVRALPPGRS